jgi:hypothetical protein
MHRAAKTIEWQDLAYTSPGHHPNYPCQISLKQSGSKKDFLTNNSESMLIHFPLNQLPMQCIRMNLQCQDVLPCSALSQQ